jgi:hypothetical protein
LLFSQVELDGALEQRLPPLLRDDVGKKNVEEFLSGLANTAFETNRLAAALNLVTPVKDWQVGESLAEAYLVDHKDCEFPWPTGRDLRNPKASPAGADSALEGNDYVELKYQYPPYDVGKMQTFDWRDTNIRKEAQGVNKDADSVQAKLIREPSGRAYDMIIDDHSKGEAADVVTIRRLGTDQSNPSQIEIEFYHCKRSMGAQKGARLDDLYEVCGQAQKSICWMFSPEKSTDLFTHLLRREATRRDANAPSRYEVGDRDLLLTIREMSRTCPVSLKICIVQPGLSKAQASREQLELLSVTENHLKETYQIDFGVIAND